MTKRPLAYALLTVCAVVAFASPSRAGANWGTLAPDGSPMAGVYFFAGDPYQGCTTNQASEGTGNYTMYPVDPRNLYWNESTANQDYAIHSISSAGANVIVMSYWDVWISSNCALALGGPMQSLEFTSYDQLFAAVARENAVYRRTSPLQILPAIEGIRLGNDDLPAAQLPGSESNPSVFLVGEIEDLVNHYLVSPASPSLSALWAKMFDLKGNAVYAVNLLHVGSVSSSDPQAFAQGLDAVRDKILTDTNVRVGFTIDPWNPPGTWAPTPRNQAFASSSTESSFLAIQAFNPEIIQGYDPQAPAGSTYTITSIDGAQESVPDSYNACPNASGVATCTDNNSRVEDIVRLKRAWVEAWVDTGLPVILDVSAGYDGHYIFEGSPVGIYGDNSQDGIDDRWRNGEGQMKRSYSNGLTLKGIVYNAWNGYMEGLTAVPSCAVFDQRTSPLAPPWVEPSECWNLGSTQYDWMSAELRINPALCDYQQFTDGALDPNGHVWGAICDYWQALGAQAGYGAPTMSQMPTPGNPSHSNATGPQMNDFAGGGAIYWGPSTGAHEVHGAIRTEYVSVGQDKSCLGLPTSDERAWSIASFAGPVARGRQNAFQNGEIDWAASTGAAACMCHGWASAGCSVY